MSKIQYQVDGAEKAYKKLFKEGWKRYLLADEVGLGKTITAASVIAKLWDDRSNSNKDIRIGYICANKALAQQNIRKLKARVKEINPDVKIDECASENLSMGFLNLDSNHEEGKISIYIVTPSTTIKAISNGKAEERAYAYWLILKNEKEINDITKQYLRKACVGKAQKKFEIDDNDEDFGNSRLDDLVRGNISKISEEIQKSFIALVDEEIEKKEFTKIIKDTSNEKRAEEIIRLARKCMSVVSVRNMDMDLFIADEIQNYSDLFRTKCEDNETEMDLVIKEIVQGDKKLLLMSATPFRYHSLLNELENAEKDADADSNDDDPEESGIAEKYGKSQEYLEKNSDIYAEFQNIIRYLKEDFDFKQWEEHNSNKIKAIRCNDHDQYQQIVSEQGIMLKNANVSRVERYMSGIDLAFKTVNKEIPVNELMLKEMKSVPKTKFVADVLDIDQIKQGDKLIISPTEDYWYIYHEHEYFIAPEEFVDEVYYLIESDYGEWDIEVDEEDKECSWFIWKADKNERFKGLEKKLQKGDVRLDYLKSTPALFSFKYGYKKLNDMVEETGQHTLSDSRIRSFEPLFAKNKNDAPIYNARIASLFTQLFDREELHQLLFIPPSHQKEGLDGVFKNKYGVSKRLFFTDYNMTPKSLSALITYEAGRRVVEDLKKRREGTIVYFKESNKKIEIPALCNALKSGSVQLNPGIEKDLYQHDKERYDTNQYMECDRKSGSPYSYAVSRKNLFSNEIEIETFCKAYYKYMTRISALRITLAYTDTDNIYDAILQYGKNGCIWDVFDEYSEYIVKSEKECFADAFKRVIELQLGHVNAITKDDSGIPNGVSMCTDFATGHFAGNSMGNVPSAKTLDHKLQRFNSPFWPFQFISTSIGQEGFDFHVYCRKIVHWSLECNPVKFEQREGRVNRYQGYANRLQLCKLFDRKGWDFPCSWRSAFDFVREQNDQDIVDYRKKGNGLFPDFVVPRMDDSYGLERETYYYPGSFESEEFKHVLEAVGYYRSLLGQSGSDTYEEEFKKFMEGEKNVDNYFINLYPDSF